MSDLKFTDPGVYFNMPFADYLADPSLSASGIKDLLIAPETFWERSPMNPDREAKDSEALAIGSAHHTRILEGREAFDAQYAIKPNPDDYHDLATTADEIKALCKIHGLSRTGTKLEVALRLHEVHPDLNLWPIILRDFEVAAEGKTILKHDWADKVEARAQILEAIPEVRKAITGGYPEVSIFWRDPKTGVPLKARIDYLKPRAQVDLKSFTNTNGMPVDVAIARAVANYRYHVQAVVHSEAVTQAKALMRAGRYTSAPGLAPIDMDKQWLQTFVDTPQHAFIFLFLEKTSVPSIRLKEFPRFTAPNGPGSKTVSLAWETGEGAFRIGVNLYQDFMERFGPDKPWLEVPPLSAFCDEDFPLYMMD